MTTTNTNVRFAYQNYLEDTATSVTASSELTDYETTNISGGRSMARWAEWRGDGAFVITTSNQKFYYNNGANNSGADDEITVPVGTYTPTELAAQLTTQLDSDWPGSTCTYTADKAFLLRINKAGHTYQFSNTTNAIWDTLGYTLSTDTSFSTANASMFAQEARVHTYEQLIFDLGTAREVDFFCVLPAASETFAVGAGATITLEGSTTAGFSSPAITRTLTRTDAGIFEFLDDEVTTNYRYWRYKFIDRENTTSGPEGFGHAIIYLGSYSTFTNRTVNRGFQKVRTDLSEIQTAVGGAKFALTRPRLTRFTNVGMSFLDDTDRATLETVYDTVGNHKPFIVSLDPRTEVTSAVGDLTFPVTFDSFGLTHIKTSIYSFNLSMTEVV